MIQIGMIRRVITYAFNVGFTCVMSHEVYKELTAMIEDKISLNEVVEASTAFVTNWPFNSKNSLLAYWRL